MAIRHGIVASSVSLPPTITIASTTNFNQSIATFNATVNPNGFTTSVKFQYSTNGSSWNDSGTVSNITGGSQSVYYNHTGLTENTLYYIRAVATNPAGSSTSSNTTFTTWHFIDFGTASSTTVTIPTVTPTGGSAVVPSLYEICVSGGGAGANFSGGGGGQVVVLSSQAFNNASNLVISVNVGGGGGVGVNGTASTLTNSSFTTVSANGGYTNSYVAGGTNGDGVHVGGATVETTDGSFKNPMYATGYGGGGGATANGGNGSVNPGYPSYAYGYGGNGGAGYYHARWSGTYGNGLIGSGGGGGWVASTGGGNGSAGGGTWGCGGSCNGTTSSGGNSGAIWFRYYGP
jgi:hypothetical protein